MTFDQAEFDIRCEWGLPGVLNLAPISDAIIIVDVLSFSTCVSVALTRGAKIYPFRTRGAAAVEYAKSLQAEISQSRGKGGYSLSPCSMMTIPTGTKVVLPSPNGASLTLSTGDAPTFTGCLRNAKAVAQAALQFGNRITLIPAGERWHGDGSIRHALEDYIGAGAILQHLPGVFSPEAEAARAVYNNCCNDLLETLARCSSGKELIDGGFEKDIEASAVEDCDNFAPLLQNGCFVPAAIAD
ncbi:MAG: 2-phosphosulfolactate phosphatase [bacterium]|nr:2-phosphosulfolactate phosphatase [bacterium]